MQTSDTPHDAEATTLTEEGLAAIIDAIGIYQRQQRTFAGITRTDQETLANCTNRLIAEVRAQRQRIAAQDRVVAAARLVADMDRWDDMWKMPDNAWELVYAPKTEDVEALQQALAALEADNGSVS